VKNASAKIAENSTNAKVIKCLDVQEQLIYVAILNRNSIINGMYLTTVAKDESFIYRVKAE
jgi:hypothetical protein